MTIRRRDDHSVDPSSHRIILKIVEFQNCLMDFVTFDWFCSFKWNNCFTFANGKKFTLANWVIFCNFDFCHSRRNSFGSSSNVTIEKWKRRTPSLLDRKLQEQKLRTLWPVFFYQIMLGEKKLSECYKQFFTRWLKALLKAELPIPCICEALWARCTFDRNGGHLNHFLKIPLQFFKALWGRNSKTH